MSRWEWPLVTHRFEPGWRRWVPDTEAQAGGRWERPDKTRCERCGRREGDKAHPEPTITP